MQDPISPSFTNTPQSLDLDEGLVWHTESSSYIMVYEKRNPDSHHKAGTYRIAVLVCSQGNKEIRGSHSIRKPTMRCLQSHLGGLGYLLSK